MSHTERAIAMKKDLEHYLRLRYPIELVEAEEGGYFARIPDLPGCIAQGETIDETLKSLEGAKSAWMEVRLEDGLDIPLPREVIDEYSGKFLLRVPKSFHRELATRAREEGTSLNQYVLYLLSLGLGLQRGHVQPFAVEMLGEREVFLTQVPNKAREVFWRQRSSTTQEPRRSLNLFADYPSREEAEQDIPVYEIRSWFQPLWGLQGSQELGRKDEALFPIGLTRKRYLAPKA